MSQSLVQNYMHLVFSTKYREPFIQPPAEAELYQYLGGICNEMECNAVKVGGYTDHVHILCMLSKKVALVTLMEELKKASSIWMKKQEEAYKHFYWQRGYGAFSVSASEIERVILYIANQHIHHGRFTYQEEYRAMLKRYQVKYNELHVWD